MTRLLPTIAALALTAALAALVFHVGDAGPSRAEQGESSIFAIAIDTNPAAAPANTASSFGSIETCVSGFRGDQMDVDIVVDSVPADRPLTGFQFDVLYDPKVVLVSDWNGGLMLAGAGDWLPIDVLTETVPDKDGRFTIAVADFGDSHETGPGTLVRLTFGANDTGVSTIKVGGEILMLDDQNEIIPVQSFGEALIAVNRECQAAQGTPVAKVNLQPKGTPYTGPPPSVSVTVPPEEVTPVTETPPTVALPPGLQTPEASADAEASPTVTPGAGNDDDSGSDDGFPYWIIAPIAVGGLAAVGGAAYLVRRRAAARG